MKKNNEAAWKVYSSGNGLNKHCIQFEIDVVEFRKELFESGFLIEERVVNYEDDDYIMNLHNPKKSEDYVKYFRPFTLQNFFSLLSIKRKAYAYEQEVRFFAIPKIKDEVRNNRKKGRSCRYKDKLV